MTGLRALDRTKLTITARTLRSIASLAMPSAFAAPVVRSPGEPVYEVELTTGGQGHVWIGTQSISFTNQEASQVSSIYLRLWSNGVLGCGGAGGGSDSIEIATMTGGVASPAVLDCTRVEITLDAPLEQGDRTTISFDLRIEVPARNDRFGYHKGLALLGTALPTLEVHDDQGWHPDTFVDLGESFYSITGRYRVTLNTPAALDTPTTGRVASRTRSAPRRTSTTYVARDVRDFAWAAGRLAPSDARCRTLHEHILSLVR